MSPPKQVSENNLDAILFIIAECTNGATIEDIFTRLTPNLPRRTLQRRLAELVKAQRVTMVGQGRSTRYISTSFIYPMEEPVATAWMIKEPGEIYIPVSSSGEDIREIISQPIHQRSPVGYRREFLDAYQPNVTQYLPDTIRQHLYALGQPLEPHPAGTHARQVLNRLLIDLSWNSSRLEGNTYSLLETECLLQRGEMAEGKNVFETQMILNHKAAIEFLVQSIDDIGFDRYTIFNLHALLADNLLPTEVCGALRNIPVGIGKSVYRPLAVPVLLGECFDQVLKTANAIEDPFEQSFFVMVHLPYLQPFEDVNKRVSRLAANIPLIRNNFSPLSFIDMPERSYLDGLLGIYELNRIDLLRDLFVWAYERSAAHYPVVCQSVGEPDPFCVRYRALLKGTVAAVVRHCYDRKAADIFIKQEADNLLTKEDRPRFVEIAERELRALHEGNMARYRIRPIEFIAWQRMWNR